MSKVVSAPATEVTGHIVKEPILGIYVAGDGIPIEETAATRSRCRLRCAFRLHDTPIEIAMKLLSFHFICITG
jgi:hypothetical protein